MVQTEKSAIADVLSNSKHYSTRLYRETIEIHKHVKKFNKKYEAVNVIKIWHSVIK